MSASQLELQLSWFLSCNACFRVCPGNREPPGADVVHEDASLDAAVQGQEHLRGGTVRASEGGEDYGWDDKRWGANTIIIISVCIAGEAMSMRSSSAAYV